MNKFIGVLGRKTGNQGTTRVDRWYDTVNVPSNTPIVGNLNTSHVGSDGLYDQEKQEGIGSRDHKRQTSGPSFYDTASLVLDYNRVLFEGRTENQNFHIKVTFLK